MQNYVTMNFQAEVSHNVQDVYKPIPQQFCGSLYLKP